MSGASAKLSEVKAVRRDLRCYSEDLSSSSEDANKDSSDSEHGGINGDMKLWGNSSTDTTSNEADS